MASKMLDEVLLKEKQAAEKEQQARVAAQNITDEASARARQIIDEAGQAADREQQERLARAQEDSEKLCREALDEADEIIGGLRAQASDRFSEAVGKVKEIISK